MDNDYIEEINITELAKIHIIMVMIKRYSHLMTILVRILGYIPPIA